MTSNDTYAGILANIVIEEPKARFALDREIGKLSPSEREEITKKIFQLPIGTDLASLPSKNGSGKTSWTIAELLETEFPEPPWIVPGIIPVGLVSLSGRPKVGKSWLALQIAHAKSTGGKCFGKDIDRGDVIYYAFEDPGRRLQNRAIKQGIPETASLRFDVERTILQKGGLEKLKADVSNGAKLIIIDTLYRFLGGVDENDQGLMTRLLEPIQTLSNDNNMTILMIDHNRKPRGYGDGNPTDDLLGATSKSAMCDTLTALYKEQGKRGATLSATGRDIDEVELALTWDGDLWCWKCEGLASDVRRDSFAGDVIEAIETLTELGELTTTQRIASHLDSKRSNVSRELSNLLNSGKVTKGEKVGREQPYQISKPVEV